MTPIIGVDFDNTIALYTELAHTIAREMHLIPPEGITGGKDTVRDYIRSSPAGDEGWQQVQAEMYGPRMGEAILAPGFPEFVKEVRDSGYRLVIVSHKTQFSNLGRSTTDLRESALSWMMAHGFFSHTGLAFEKGDVSFASTRLEKVLRIRELGCSWFIDDLPEVFAEPAFPPTTKKILFGSDGDGTYATGESWHEIPNLIFPHSPPHIF